MHRSIGPCWNENISVTSTAQFHSNLIRSNIYSVLLSTCNNTYIDITHTKNSISHTYRKKQKKTTTTTKCFASITKPFEICIYQGHSYKRFHNNINQLHIILLGADKYNCVLSYQFL